MRQRERERAVAIARVERQFEKWHCAKRTRKKTTQNAGERKREQRGVKNEQDCAKTVISAKVPPFGA